MKENIIKIAEDLIEVRELIQELNDKDYWIEKASKETNFVPAEGDWIHVEVTLFRIEVSVCHKDYNGDKYWINGHWYDSHFGAEYSLPEKMLAEIRAW